MNAVIFKYVSDWRYVRTIREPKLLALAFSCRHRIPVELKRYVVETESA